MIRETLVVIGVFVPVCLLALPFGEHTNNTESPESAIGLKLSGGVHSFQKPHNFDDFLKKCFQRPVLEYTIKPLTKYGDNFAAVVQALEVKLSKYNNSSEFETLQLVVKGLLPGTNNTQELKQFQKEVQFYSEVLLALERFEKNANIPETEHIDTFARYYCSRLSLNPGAANADTDALILFENLKTKLFVSPSGSVLLDKDEILACLKTLAKLHAIFIAMRRLQPNHFYSEVDPHLAYSFDVAFVDMTVKRVRNFIAIVPANFSNTSPQLLDMVNGAVTLFEHHFLISNRVPDTPYTTFYHADLWTKNVMIRQSNTANTSIQIKFLDFQFYYYESFALDLTQFLFINGRANDLRSNFKSFVDYYISEFVKTLQLFNCPLDDYTNEKMWNEIKDKAKLSLGKIYSIFGHDKTLMLDNSTRLVSSGRYSEDIYYNQSTPEVLLQRWKSVTDLYVENGLL